MLPQRPRGGRGTLLMRLFERFCSPQADFCQRLLSRYYGLYLI
jgi:hypothetical protein